MGSNIEGSKRSLPPELRAEHAGLMIADRVENIMAYGAVIYSNGDFGGYSLRNLKLPSSITEDLQRGRLVICSTKDMEPEAGLPSLTKPRKALLIPEGSDKRLAYRVAINHRRDPVLLQGIDKDGKPVLDDVFTSYGFLRFFERMAQRQILKQEVEPNEGSSSYRRFLTRKLMEMAQAENGGLGEVNKAVEKMKQEMQEVADEVEEFINGNNH